ncbi:PWP2 protein, partial [Larus smithsonianus]|nr:PWP2 protein [Larus smithsonianus]
VLSGHEGPISSLSFNPMKSVLASASWDKTVKLWDMLDSWRTKETLILNSDVLVVAFRPDGKELAVASLNGQITFWDHENAVQTGSIEGRHDLQMGRKELDKITAKQAAKGKSFTTLCYSADGQSILAGGLSKFVCIYNVKEQILMKKFEISCNFSLDAMEVCDHSSQFFFHFPSLPPRLRFCNEESSVYHYSSVSILENPAVCLNIVTFLLGRSWAATTTEGLLIYSLDSGLIFDPFELDIDITPSNIHKTLHQKEYTKAIIMAFKLNEKKLIQEVIEAVPSNE